MAWWLNDMLTPQEDIRIEIPGGGDDSGIAQIATYFKVHIVEPTYTIRVEEA